MFLADGAVINFGADQDTNITHVADTGLTTNRDFTVGGDLFLTGGLIDLKNDGNAVSQIKFYCESSNAHAQTLIGAPHSQSATNTLTLPDGSSGVLLSTVSTATVTNKTLTSPVINTGTFGTSILPVSADGTTLGSATKEFSDLFLADASVIQFGNDQDVSLTHVADTGLLLSSSDKLMFNDHSQFIQGVSGTVLDIAATDEIELTATLIDVVGNLTVSGTAAITGIATFTDDIIIGDGKTIGSASDVDAITIASNGQLTLTQTLIGTALDISGDIDVDGTSNLDIVDIDGAVDMASTLVVAGTINTLGITGPKTNFVGSMLISNDAGTGTLSSASNNTGFGHEVFDDLTSGDGNTAVGFESLSKLTTGGSNTAVGLCSMALNTTGALNTSVGQTSLKANTEGCCNTAMGGLAMNANTTGDFNTSLGAFALKANTTADNNVAVGYLALCTNTTGTSNTAVGASALKSNTTLTDNTAVGHEALCTVKRWWI